MGTRTPEAVADAVVRGIEHGKAELNVAPLGMRVGARLWGLSPTAMGALQRRMGSLKIADELAAGQRSKRWSGLAPAGSENRPARARVGLELVLSRSRATLTILACSRLWAAE